MTGGVVLVDGVGGEDALVPEALHLARRPSPSSSGASSAVPTPRSRRSTDVAPVPPSFSSLPPSGLATPLHPLTAAAVGQLGSPLGYGGGGEGGREGGVHTHGMISEVSSLTDALDYASASGEGGRGGERGRGWGSLLPSTGLGFGMWRAGREGGREAELEEDHDHVLDRSDVHSEEMNERDEEEEEEGEEEDGVEADDGDDKQREEGALEAEQRGSGEEREGISSEESSSVSSAGRSIVTDSQWQAVLARTTDKKG